MRLTEVRRFTVSAALAEETRKALCNAGSDGFELFALWSGIVEGEEAHVVTLHIPEQTSYKTENGLVVRVEGPALHKLNMWLYEHSHVLLAQIHAHPTDAYHSETDDAYPIVTAVGGVSIVVPNFAKDDDLLGEGTLIYRFDGATWVEATPDDSVQVFEVIT